MPKVIMYKKIDGSATEIYPRTTADIVMYDENTNVSAEDIINALTVEINKLKKALDIDTLYKMDENGILPLNDGYGTNLVSVASLVSSLS